MLRILKILGGLVGVLVLLVVAAAIIIPLVVDPNDFREEISAKAKEETGRDIVIAGDLDLSVFPWLALEVNDLRVPDPTSDAAFASLENARIGVRLMPLLRQQVQVGVIEVTGLKVNLVREADGTANWDDFADDSAPATPAEPGTAPESRPAAARADVFPEVEGIRIRDASVRYVDKATAEDYTVTVPNFTIGRLALDTAVPIQARVVAEIAEPAVTLDTNFSATMTLTKGGEAVSLRSLTTDLDASGEPVRGGRRRVSFAASTFDVDMAEGTLALREAVLRVDEMRAALSATGTGLNHSPEIKGQLDIPVFSPRKLMTAFGVEVPATADATVLTRMSLKSAFSVEGGAVGLDGLALVLDDSRLEGTASVGGEEVTELRATLALDTMDLDRYLPPETAAEAAAAEEVEEEVVLPVEELEGIDADVRLTAGTLTVSGVALTGLDARMVVRNKRLEISPLKADVFGGKLDGRVMMDGGASPPRVELRQSLSAIQLGPMLTDLAEFDRLTGRADAAVDIRAQGATTAAMIPTLNGNASLSAEDGEIRGMRWLYELQALLRGEKAEGSGDATKYKDLSGTATITNGVVTNRDLQVVIPFVNLTGAGTVDLPEEVVDYELVARFGGTPSDPGAGGPQVPVRVTGNMADPSFKWDLSGLVKGDVESELRERLGIEDDEQSTEDALKEEAKKRLRDLIGG